MRTLIAGGGTGGHLTPALAVAQALRRSDPEGAVILVGRRGGVEERLVPAAGLPLETLQLAGVDVTRPLRTALGLLRLPAAVLRSRRLIRRHRADVVVGAAGYVCVPVVLAARTLGVPVVLLEQNAVPGRAVRLLASHARVVAASFAETAARLPRARVVHTGNPLRPEVVAAQPAPLREQPGMLLVMGGSQGARRINQALLGCVTALLREHPALRVVHACGPRDAADVTAAAAALPEDVQARYEVAPFFDDIAQRVAASDLVVMRAGGSSLAEVSALGRPMLLVPYPHAGAHQAENAAPYVRAGAAALLADADCTSQRLRAEVDGLLGDAERRRSMGTASAALGRPDAAERVVALLHEVAA